MNPKRLRLYSLLIFLIVSLSILGLTVNIKSVQVNDRIQKLNQDIKVIKENNARLRLEVQTETRLEKIEEKAVKELNMVPRKKLYVLHKKP